MRQYVLLRELDELDAIRRQLFSFDLNDAELGILIARKIYGFGTAGATGLLSLLFPEYFGSVDQFVVKAFGMIESLPVQIKYRVDRINPSGIKPNEGALLVNIMRDKAKELNAANNTALWTPRKIDMVLWAAR
jgi:hypothetical protein